MDIEKILKTFALIANLTTEESEPWRELCTDSMNEINRMLKNSIDQETNGRRLTVAVASLAFYNYILYKASGGRIESLTTNEIKVTTDIKIAAQMALNVWLQARNAVCDLLKDESFIFEGVV